MKAPIGKTSIFCLGSAENAVDHNQAQHLMELAMAHAAASAECCPVMIRCFDSLTASAYDTLARGHLFSDRSSRKGKMLCHRKSW